MGLHTVVVSHVLFNLGAGDTDLLKRIITLIGGSRYRALVNVGDYESEYTDIPDNVQIDSWFPQP